MLVEISNKILMLLFFMSALNSLRHIYYFIQAFFSSTEELPSKYRLNDRSLYLLGISLAYILTVVFTGIKL